MQCFQKFPPDDGMTHRIEHANRHTADKYQIRKIFMDIFPLF